MQENFEFEINKRKAKVIQRLYEEKTAETIAKYLMRKLKEYVTTSDDHDDDERSVNEMDKFLQKRVVFKAVRTSFDILNDLEIPSSSLNVIKQTLCFLKEIAYNVGILALSSRKEKPCLILCAILC